MNGSELISVVISSLEDFFEAEARAAWTAQYTKEEEDTEHRIPCDDNDNDDDDDDCGENNDDDDDDNDDDDDDEDGDYEEEE